MVWQISYPSKCGGYVHRSSTLNEGACEESRLHHSPQLLSPQIHKPNEIACPEGIYMGLKSLYCTRQQQQHRSDLYLCAYTLQVFAQLIKTQWAPVSVLQRSVRALIMRGKNSSYLSFHVWLSSLIYTELLIHYECTNQLWMQLVMFSGQCWCRIQPFHLSSLLQFSRGFVPRRGCVFNTQLY